MTKKGTTGAKRDRGAGGRGPDDDGQVDGSGEERSGALSVSIGMGNVQNVNAPQSILCG